MPSNFSIEAVILGRNDDYEPNWTENLFSAIKYNRALFEGTNVDFRVAFVEWNPPEGRPLLSPDLLQRYPFLRAIVVDREVHQALCTAPNLPMMINFGFNAAFRTCGADFTMTTCGDDLWSTKLVERICSSGLKVANLYRAERTNIKRDLPFSSIDTATLERPENVLFVDTCSEPPYNVPPYTNACGDFSLTDSGTMFGFGGMDESVREARLHLDSRLCINAMAVVEDCTLLGPLYHITHANSWSVKKRVGGRQYVWDEGMPYVNPPDWGLANYNWQRLGDRYYSVSMPVEGSRSAPESLSDAARAQADAVRDCLMRIRAALQPEKPTEPAVSIADAISLWTVAAASHWDTNVHRLDTVLRLETPAERWAPAAIFPVRRETITHDGNWHWVHAVVNTEEGAISISVVDEKMLPLSERYLQPGDSEKTFIPFPPEARAVLVRNIDDNDSRSIVLFRELELVSQPKTKIG